ncbi:MAG TPA: hypothetical protein VLM80_06125 [Anaerolineales bacterium]|nr:hypothetical protein [Anaerolineales bacterium]
MAKNEVVTGLQRAWMLKDKLGEGDAGEVFQVESLIEKKPAIIKRPVHSAFTSDIIRQAAQIEREARILRVLALHKFPEIQISTPKCLDQSSPGSEFSERFFIIITEANGINLAGLARAARFGVIHEDEILNLAPSGLTAFERAYLDRLVSSGQIPALVLLRVLDQLLRFLVQLHTVENQQDEITYSGVLWNDVKPDHIFYQPQTAHITLIDWGNSHFLEANGTTSDRQHSKFDDYKQFLGEMGKFLEDAAPELRSSLEWPSSEITGASIPDVISSLHTRIQEQLRSAVLALQKAQLTERKIIENRSYQYEDYIHLLDVQEQLQLLGEIPDSDAARNFAVKIAQELIKAGEIQKFSELCSHLSVDNTQDTRKWKLLARISSLLTGEPLLRSSLHYALQEDWSAVLWELRQVSRYEPSPDWWIELSTLTRELEIDAGNLPITPQTAINRLLLSLQSAFQNPTTSTPAAPEQSNPGETPGSEPESNLTRNAQLVRDLREDAAQRWSELEPTPPNSDIGYQEVLRYTKDIMELAPSAGQSLMQSLEQPLAQYRIVMDAWQRQDFDTARRGLRRILLWDPERRRLLTADLAIQAAAGWLSRLRKGPHNDEALQDFITRYELEGREIRNQVGPADWLDMTLSAMRQLRKGGEPTETLVQFPSARPYLSWLLDFQAHEPVLSTPGKQIQIQRNSQPDRIEPGLRGIHETGLGDGQDVQLTRALDTWAPEASGSSARVFHATLRGQDRRNLSVALKIMRPNRSEYALPLFREEVQILSLLRDVPGVAAMLEFGFLQLASANDLPSEEQSTGFSELRGKAIRYGLDSTHNFLVDLEKKVKQGQLPYIAIEAQEGSKNLLTLCDTGYTHGHFLPVLEGLLLCIQICDILEAAHLRNISYRDHKILHYYWDEAINGVMMIDWNIAKRHPEGLSPEEARFDLVQFGARAMHHILTGRTAPGALPLGPTRPEEIEAAAKSYTVQWTFDDQRLPKSIKEILEKVMSGEYEKPRQLKEDLTLTFKQLSELAQQENQEDQSTSTLDELGNATDGI